MAETPGRLEARSCQVGAPRRGRGWQPISEDVREVDAGALDHLPLLENTRAAATALRTLPCILDEGAAILRLELLCELVLKSEQECPDRSPVRGAVFAWFHVLIRRFFSATLAAS